METSEEEDRQLGELGYTQKLSRSVGGVSSFFLGFSVISATTAVFSGFGFGPVSYTHLRPTRLSLVSRMPSSA